MSLLNLSTFGKNTIQLSIKTHWMRTPLIVQAYLANVLLQRGFVKCATLYKDQFDMYYAVMYVSKGELFESLCLD